ncbi:MAG: serine/threonine protein kinase [marine benthic group bacterium]|nr:serine/threonine protein kinase [Gemmatimonadota bacterium]
MIDRHIEKAGARRPTEPSLDHPGRSGFRGLMTEVQRDSYRRLGWIAGVLAAIGVVVMAAHFLLPADQQEHVGIDVRARASLIVLSLVVLGATRLKNLPPEWFPVMALLYEVAVGAVLATEFLYWPTLGEHGDFLLGVPRTTLWVVFFANVVPLRPREHLGGAAVATGFSAVWFFVGGNAAAASLSPAEAQALWERGFQLFPGLLLSIVIATGLAYLSARRVYGLSRALSRARKVGAYELTKMLGKGGMGEVWRARHQMLARPAAIKLIRSDRTTGTSASDAEYYLERFQREVQATASLRSPHTIEIYDYGITPDRAFYYVMELLDGEDLDGLIKKHGPMSPARVVHLMRQMCHSLAEAHDAGLIHRDIKPANIFLCRHGREVDYVKVLDFGLVKELKQMQAAHLTQVGTFAGTPAFGSPEAAAGKVDQLGPASDIYSVGCVAYWLLTGETVFKATGAMEMLASHIRDEPVPPSERTELELPPELDEVILRCLEKDPDSRIRTADELAGLLAELERVYPWTEEEARAWWVLNRPESTG